MVFIKLLIRISKIHTYKSLIRPVVTNGCETWVLKDIYEQQLRVFERKVMRKAYSTVKSEDRSWRVRTNKKIDVLMKHAYEVEYIKSQRISWIVHIVGSNKERMVKRVTEWRPMAARRICRPMLRWEDVREDSKMKIQDWSEMAMDKEAWRINVEQAKITKSCSAKRRRRISS